MAGRPEQRGSGAGGLPLGGRLKASLRPVGVRRHDEGEDPSRGRHTGYAGRLVRAWFGATHPVHSSGARRTLTAPQPTTATASPCVTTAASKACRCVKARVVHLGSMPRGDTLAVCVPSSLSAPQWPSRCRSWAAHRRPCHTSPCPPCSARLCARVLPLPGVSGRLCGGGLGG